tara:strand:- start:100 stop:423 length:324 start_codon:yes stop_codon:yes gene_type:complete
MKSDIQATRTAAAAGATAVIAGPIRVRAISVASSGGGDGFLELTTTSNAGTTLLAVDVPSGDVINLNLPEDGILFPQGVFIKTKTNLTAFTLFTDVYNAPGLTGQNG